MLLTTLAEKYSLPPDVVNFAGEYGYDAAERDYHWPLEELEHGALCARWRQLGLPGGPEQAEKALAEAGKCECFRHLFYYLYFYWYKFEGALIYNHRLPDMGRAVSDSGERGLLELLMAAAGCSAVEKKFASLGLPDEYAAAAVRRVGEDCAAATRQAGRLTYPASGHHWMRFFVEGRLFRIGRFEFMNDPEVMKFAPAVYRRRQGGEVVALCRDGWKFDRDGWRLWRDYPDEEPFAVTAFEDSGDVVCGTPVNPSGFAELHKRAVLKKENFEPVWQDDDLVPEIHIPPGGNMSIELCRKSLLDAVDFFERYFQRTPKAFISFSWIFNPDFCDILPESNLTKFMREIYLTPFAGSSLSGLSFVFGREDKDWSSYPAETSLQRAFHTLRLQNRRLKTGGMFIEARGIGNFGNALYRREYEEMREIFC